MEKNQSITPAQRNLISVFEYLLHLDKAKENPISRLADHKQPFFHESIFVGLPGIGMNIVNGDVEIWLRIRRLHAKAPPAPSQTLRPWISVPNDPSKSPVMEESIWISETNETQQNNAVDALIEIRLEDKPEIKASYDQYLMTEWKPWAESEKPRRRTIELYDRFFSLHQEAFGGGGNDNAIEVAWGIGMALWFDKESDLEISYPIISKSVEIQIDEKTLSLDVIPTEQAQRLHLEPFHKKEILHSDDVEKRAEAEFENAKTTFSPFDSATFESVLRYAVGRLDSHGVYWPEKTEDNAKRNLPSPTDHLVVTDTWVIFARNRGTNYIVSDIERLKCRVMKGEPIGGAPALMVTGPLNQTVNRASKQYRGISTPGIRGDEKELAASYISVSDNLFFPKPYNAEQITIVDRAEQADGVVVQGPPGTGKTHTIANIICHYLALGRRVLVTSMHEAPLAVLRNQIPEPLRPLTISLLTSEREGLKQIEQSVRKIAGEIAMLDLHDLARQIENESSHIDKLHEQLAGIDREIFGWVSKQTSEVPYLGDGTRPELLAKYFIEQEAAHAWFPDLFSEEEPPLPQFGEEDIAELRSARANLGSDLIYIGQNLPQADQLLNIEDFARSHHDLCHYHTVNDTVIKAGSIPQLRRYSAETIKLAEDLQVKAREIETALHACNAPWHNRARILLLSIRKGGGKTPAAQILLIWAKQVLELEKKRQAFLADAIEIPSGAELHDLLYTAVCRSAAGKRPFGLFGGDRETKALLNQIRIRATKPADSSAWRQVQEYLVFARDARSLAVQWDQLRQEIDGPEIQEFSFPKLAKNLLEVARSLARLWKIDNKLAPPFIEQAKAVFARGFAFDRLPYDIKELSRLIETLNTHLKHSRLKAALTEKKVIQEAIIGTKGPIFDQIEALLEKQLGRPETSTEVIMDSWSAILMELRRLATFQNDFNVVEKIAQMIECSGAVHWASLVRTTPPADDVDQITPSNWRAAWEWARAKAYLDAIDGRTALHELAKRRQGAEESLSQAYQNIVELRTWRKLKENMTGSTSAALQSYLTAITRIGRGTGLRATRFRRDARKAMDTAYGAVPCWIMPHWRVSEAFPAEFGLFDLVIIDEASQSDVWALPAIARGKKILVVGDDKQVSPSDVGAAEADIVALKRRFLADLPYGEHLLPGSSIYDLASTMFATDVIRLREHFRCVEPIISFSNNNFYAGEIRPLRIPKPSERLDPPLIDVYVKSGYRSDRKKINKPEARFILEEIRVITEDSKMENRTIGVVSLLGSDQAKYIQELLVSELGKEVFLRHGIRCGDAMHFQGKEADIIFISMVAAGRIRADSGRTYEQRYNVACSRARDRLYLVRSFSRQEIDNNDLRARLLDHLATPNVVEAAETANLRQLCESNFEREVFDELVIRGYRVRPQVHAGGYLIDLVVEGDDDRRLAIECDGDQYHGVDQWMHDYGRQRILERMGWRFWRCWGSSWIMNRDKCFADLVQTLEERGINPIGMDGAVGRQLVEHRVIEPATVEQDNKNTLIVLPSDADQRQITKPTQPETVSDKGNGQMTLSFASSVEVGSKVRYIATDEPDQTLEVRIVAEVSQPLAGTINENTPLAEAFLGTEPGDEVDVYLPIGTRRFRILETR